MHHHDVEDHRPRATRGRRRVRAALLALAVAGAVGLGTAGTAQATPISSGQATLDPGDPLTLYPDPWDDCYVAYGEEVTPDDDCPPVFGDIVIVCNGIVCTIWPEAGVPDGVPDPDNPDEILCPPGLPGSPSPWNEDQPCGGGMPPWDDPGPPQP